MDFVILAVLSFLSVVGVVELIRKFVFWLYKPMKTTFYMGVVIKDANQAENTVRSLVERIKWMEIGNPVDIIIVDKTENPEVKLIVKKIIENFPNISLLTK